MYDATRVIDELIDAGFQALGSDDPAAFVEWRRRVAVALGPDHMYTQFFQDHTDKERNSGMTSASILRDTNEKRVARNKRVA